MKENFSLFFSDNLLKLIFVASIVILISQSVLVGLFYPAMPPLVPFLNSQPWGEERLYESISVLSIPAVLFAIFILNTFLGVALYKKNTLISRLLVFNVFLCSILTLLAFTQIVFLVF